MLKALACLTVLAVPASASANDFEPVREQGEFLRLVQDRVLRIGLYDLAISLMPDGRIEGSALGWPITGAWKWQDGYFCREMDWSGTPIAYNCQLVEVQGGDKLRFTVDKGAGDAAVFRLR